MSRTLTAISIFKGVPLDKTYKHVINFSSDAKFQAYLSTFTKLTFNGSYQSINKPVRYPTDANGFNDLIDYNYIMINSTDTVGKAKVFYGFITNLEYDNDGMCYIYYSIDMFNTYRWNVQYQQAFIERGFVKELKDATNFTDLFNQIKNNSEDIGGDGCGQLVKSNMVWFTEQTKTSVRFDDTKIKFILITTQPKDAATENGTQVGAYSEYHYYFLAYCPATSLCYSIYLNGKEITNLDGISIFEAYSKMAKDPDLAGTNSLVVDAEIYNYIGLPFTISADSKNINIQTNHQLQLQARSPLTRVILADVNVFQPQIGVLGKNATETIFQSIYTALTARYGKDAPVKLLGVPFCKIYFSNGRGAETTLDPLQFNSLSSNIQVRRYGGISENGRETYAIDGYNQDTTDENAYPVHYEMAQIIDDSPRDVPIVLDNYTMFLNSNRNQLKNTRANAKMNEKLSKAGNSNALSNQERSIATSRKAQEYTQGRNLNKSTVMGAISGAQGGLLAGGILGAIGGGVTGALTSHAITSYNNNTSMNASNMSRRTALENAKVNNAFNNEVATNNYEQTLRSQNAMLADTRNHNDQVAHEGSNYLYDYQIGNSSMHWQVFICQDAVMQNAMLYFLLFGYTINMYKNISDFLGVKSKFNYVKTSNANVQGNVNNAVKDFFNAMFDNGVTFWNENNTKDYATKDITNNNFK